MTTLLQETHEATQQETEPNLSFARVQTKWPRARSHTPDVGQRPMCLLQHAVPSGVTWLFVWVTEKRLSMEWVTKQSHLDTRPSTAEKYPNVLQIQDVFVWYIRKVCSTWKQVVLYTCCHEVGDKRAIVIKKTRTLAKTWKPTDSTFKSNKTVIYWFLCTLINAFHANDHNGI